MKIFLFLYPIAPYIDHLMKNFPHLENPMGRFNELVDVRYRSQGYQVYWLIFSKKGNRAAPDLDLIHPRVEIRDDDLLISAGLSFQRHTQKKVYPNLSYIIDQLPEDISEVKISGYHQYDCVDRVARRIHRQGTPVLVDEDLTHFFFGNLSSKGSIPDFREFTMEGFDYDHILDDEDNWIRKRILNYRKNRPWFVQPRQAPA